MTSKSPNLLAIHYVYLQSADIWLVVVSTYGRACWSSLLHYLTTWLSWLQHVATEAIRQNPITICLNYNVYPQSICGISWCTVFKFPIGQGHKLNNFLSNGSRLNYHMITCAHKVSCNLPRMCSYAVRCMQRMGCNCMAALDKWQKYLITLRTMFTHKLRLFSPCLAKYMCLCVCVCWPVMYWVHVTLVIHAHHQRCQTNRKYKGTSHPLECTKVHSLIISKQIW